MTRDAQSSAAALHDAYAAEYDRQVQEYGCNIAELLFGMCYADIHPGERLLGAGAGSGLAGILFHRAGLEVHGFDFSPAMLEVCRAKGFAASLKLHDVTHIPWPYDRGEFDHIVCCGVFHFIPGLDGPFSEAARLLRPGGLLAFTTKAPHSIEAGQDWEAAKSGEWTIYAHQPGHVRALAGRQGFAISKFQQVFIGNDIHSIWLARREG